MTIVVADTGPLLALAKIDALWLLQFVYTNIWITPLVAHESIDAGSRIGASDAFIIAAAVQNGWMEVHAPTTLGRVCKVMVRLTTAFRMHDSGHASAATRYLPARCA
jgi:predicted nucleic acid-binding protein